MFSLPRKPGVTFLNQGSRFRPLVHTILLTCSSKLSPVLPTNSKLIASNSKLPSPSQFRGRRPLGASAGYKPWAASSTPAHSGKSWQVVLGSWKAARTCSTFWATLVTASRPGLSVASWSSPRADSMTSSLWTIPVDHTRDARKEEEIRPKGRTVGGENNSRSQENWRLFEI